MGWHTFGVFWYDPGVDYGGCGYGYGDTAPTMIFNQTRKKCVLGDAPGPAAAMAGPWPGPGRAAGFSRISG